MGCAFWSKQVQLTRLFLRPTHFTHDFGAKWSNFTSSLSSAPVVPDTHAPLICVRWSTVNGLRSGWSRQHTPFAYWLVLWVGIPAIVQMVNYTKEDLCFRRSFVVSPIFYPKSYLLRLYRELGSGLLHQVHARGYSK